MVPHYVKRRGEGALQCYLILFQLDKVDLSPLSVDIVRDGVRRALLQMDTRRPTQPLNRVTNCVKVIVTVTQNIRYTTERSVTPLLNLSPRDRTCLCDLLKMRPVRTRTDDTEPPKGI